MKNKNYKLLKNSTDEETLDDKLLFKLEKEYFEFTENLIREPKEEIFKKSYETIVKEEIKDMLTSGELDLHDKEKEILLNTDDLLTEFYHDWLNCDTPLGESMRDSIEESLVLLTRYYGKQNNKNNKIDLER